MSLSSALDTAKSSLAATQAQTQLVSRNIANMNAVGASRKYANVVTGPGGRVEIASVAQSSNAVLYRNMLESKASLGSSSVVAEGLSRIDETIGDTELARSPAALIGNLDDALQALAVSPNAFEAARAAAQGAQDLATALNEGAQTIRTIRRDADDALAAAAKDMTAILSEIEALNRLVVSGTAGGTDVTDVIDRRDAAVARLSDYVGVSVRFRGDNDMVLHADSGVTLFETSARPVEFSPTGALVPGAPGNALRIDGVAVTGETSFMPLKSGKVFGLVALRDTVAVAYETQLDEIARGLIAAFAEEDQSGGGQPDRAGLFTATGFTASTDAAAATAALVPGLAGRIRVAGAAASTPFLIRDGGFAGPDYRYNASNLAGFTGRINGLAAALGAGRSFAPEAGASTEGNLADFAASSVGWLQARRSDALAQTEYKSTLLARTQETLSDATGINLAEEMTLLIELERSYQASSKLIATIDEMLATLLQAV